jgi:hypothetical protein
MGKTDVTYKDFLLNGHPRIAWMQENLNEACFTIYTAECDGICMKITHIKDRITTMCQEYL